MSRYELSEMIKSAGAAPSYGAGQMQSMLAAGTAIRLSDGRIIPAASTRDVRYAITIAQGGLGMGGAADSAAFRNFLQRRARVLGVTLPADWGRPSTPPVTPVTSSNQAMPGSPSAKSAFPAIDTLATKAAAAQSVADALIAMANAGQLGQLEADIRRMRQAASAGHQLAKGPTPEQRAAAAKAAGYRAKASAVTSPTDRADYLALAKSVEAEAGVQ